MSGNFLKVVCPDKHCKNEQIIFNKASTIVRCQKCNRILAKPKGSKAEIKCKVLEVLENK